MEISNMFGYPFEIGDLMFMAMMMVRVYPLLTFQLHKMLQFPEVVETKTLANIS